MSRSRINIASDAPDCLTSGAARESVGRVGRGLEVAGDINGMGNRDGSRLSAPADR